MGRVIASKRSICRGPVDAKRERGREREEGCILLGSLDFPAAEFDAVRRDFPVDLVPPRGICCSREECASRCA